MNSKTRLRIMTSLLAAALFTGASCAHSQPLTALPTVGSDSGSKPVTGYLIVYTETENPISSGDIVYYPHTPYKIYDSRGVLCRSVRNHLSERDESPARVSLPPGRYTVVGKSETKGDVAVPLVVNASRTTVANL
ncbi:MAG: hypothetical protein ABJF10_20325 [Chthoniobacter sp.]|uniref:hypothetical protein n=1 Tax=Chthoniobacter sp. TaxID=2510640 RepID=UPI0032A9691C